MRNVFTGKSIFERLVSSRVQSSSSCSRRRRGARSLLRQSQPALPVLGGVVRLTVPALHAEEMEGHRRAGAAVVAQDLGRERRRRGFSASRRSAAHSNRASGNRRMGSGGEACGWWAVWLSTDTTVTSLQRSVLVRDRFLVPSAARNAKARSSRERRCWCSSLLPPPSCSGTRWALGSALPRRPAAASTLSCLKRNACRADSDNLWQEGNHRIKIRRRNTPTQKGEFSIKPPNEKGRPSEMFRATYSLSMSS